MKFIISLLLTFAMLYGKASPQADKAYEARDYTKASRLYDNSCKQKNFESCKSLGDMYLAGLGVKKSYLEAQTLYSKACAISINIGDAEGCEGIADMKLAGFIVGNEKLDEAKLKEMANNCDNNKDGDICLQTAEWIDASRGITSEFDDFVIFKEKACKNGNLNGCIAAAKYNFTYDDIRSLESATIACNASIGQGCSIIGDIYGTGLTNIKGDKKKAVTHHLKACNLGYGPGCYQLVYFFQNIDAEKYREAIKQNKKEGDMWDQLNCADGDMEACHSAGMTLKEIDIQQSIKYFKKGCIGKNYMACIELGYIYLHGTDNGVKKDKKLARSYFEWDLSLDTLEVNK